MWLAEKVQLEREGKLTEVLDETKAFRSSGKPTEELFEEARIIQNQFIIGGWILGGLLSLIFCIKIVNLTVRKKRKEYEIDTGTCYSCGRCFKYCPFEQVRLGIISPYEIDNY